MKIFIKVFAFAFFFLFLNCRSDSQNNPRAYVEGKAVSMNLDKISIKIVSGDIAVGQTMPDADGTFILSGPMRGEGFSVLANEKIKSFKTDRTALQLSSDALQIDVPAGITYLKFNEIVFEK